jgi:hypothetical protein
MDRNQGREDGSSEFGLGELMSKMIEGRWKVK